MYRCQQPPMVQPVVQPVAHKHKDSLGAHFFRWLRWSAVMMALIPIAIVGAVQWQTVRVAKYEADLKREMLKRGMSAKEIETVLRAGSQGSHHRMSAESGYYTARHAEIEAALIRDLAALNISADDIEKIYQAFTANSGSESKNHQSAERAIKDAAFVKRLAQSGRSAQEIERLLKVHARSGGEDRQAVVAAAEKSQQAKVEEALKTLLKSGLTAEELNRLIGSETPSLEKDN